MAVELRLDDERRRLAIARPVGQATIVLPVPNWLSPCPW
jgi:hypothetical protein